MPTSSNDNAFDPTNSFPDLTPSTLAELFDGQPTPGTVILQTLKDGTPILHDSGGGRGTLDAATIDKILTTLKPSQQSNLHLSLNWLIYFVMSTTFFAWMDYCAWLSNDTPATRARLKQATRAVNILFAFLFTDVDPATAVGRDLPSINSALTHDNLRTMRSCINSPFHSLAYTLQNRLFSADNPLKLERLRSALIAVRTALQDEDNPASATANPPAPTGDTPSCLSSDPDAPTPPST